MEIPAGIDSNQVLEFPGKGEAGRRGGKPGNLYLRITIKPHSLFKRKGDDLFIEIPISFSQASLGDKIEVPLLDEKTVYLKIPPGTQSGRMLRIPGKGIPHFSSYGKGDLYVKLIVKTPQKITQKQKEILKKLKEEGL